MKNFVQLIIAALLLLITSFTVGAQVDPILGSILNQLDSNQRADYFTNLNGTDLDGLGDGLDDSGVIDSLINLIDGDNPIANLDSLPEEWMGGRDFLTELIDSTNRDTLNIDAMLGGFDHVNGEWNNNFDSLGGIFDNYSDELMGGTDGLDVDDPPGQDFDSLFSQIQYDTFSNGGVGGERFGEIVNNLFNKDLYTDLELAYGQKSAGILFYDEENSNKNEIQVVRVGSVPSFSTLWESRWHASGSFTNATTTTNPDGTPNTTSGFNPLVMDFDYAIMYNPGFSFGGTSFRYISGVGIEAAMYAPSHSSTATNTNARNSRIGNTTGYGPQLSTGFSLTQGDLTTYAIASVAYGSVVCGEMLDHNYSSIKYEAGIRYSNLINVRYAVGEQSWTADLADDTGKRVRTRQQFTVGLILDTLFQ